MEVILHLTAACGAVDDHILSRIQIGYTITRIPQNSGQSAVGAAVFFIAVGVQQQVLLGLESCVL